MGAQTPCFVLQQKLKHLLVFKAGIIMHTPVEQHLALDLKDVSFIRKFHHKEKKHTRNLSRDILLLTGTCSCLSTNAAPTFMRGPVYLDFLLKEELNNLYLWKPGLLAELNCKMHVQKYVTVG